MEKNLKLNFETWIQSQLCLELPMSPSVSESVLDIMIHKIPSESLLTQAQHLDPLSLTLFYGQKNQDIYYNQLIPEPYSNWLPQSRVKHGQKYSLSGAQPCRATHTQWHWGITGWVRASLSSAKNRKFSCPWEPIDCAVLAISTTTALGFQVDMQGCLNQCVCHTPGDRNCLSSTYKNRSLVQVILFAVVIGASSESNNQIQDQVQS